MTASDVKIAGLLLAAGGSSRLGRPKQLVEMEGKTLIRRSAEALIEAGCSPLVVVLGAEVEGSVAELAGLDFEIVVNDEWNSGMSSSIRVGLPAINAAHAVLISLVDQPFVTGEKLQLLMDAFKGNSPDIVTAEYNGIAGVPAIFSSKLFPALSTLKGDKGAREIIRNSPNALTIPLPEAATDVDFPDHLLSEFSGGT